MNGYYWRGPDGWYWRENKKAENWHGPFPSRAAAKQERAKFYDRLAKARPALTINLGGN